jgi:hypothetical protein
VARKLHRARNEGAIWWLNSLMFLALSSVLFALLFEWHGYEKLCGSEDAGAGFDTLVLLWLLCSKSLIACLPVLVAAATLRYTGLKKTSAVILGTGWAVLFFWMALDLKLMMVTGNHLTDFLPHFAVMWRNPGKNYGNWLEEGVGVRAFLLLITVCGGGLAVAFTVRRLSTLLISKWRPQTSWKLVGAATALYIIGAAAVFPFVMFSDRSTMLSRVNATLPVPFQTLEVGSSAARDRETPGTRDHPHDDVRIVSVRSEAGAGETGGTITLQNAARQDVPLDGWRLRDIRGDSYSLDGLLKETQSASIMIPPGRLYLGSLWRIFLVDSEGRLRDELANADVASGKQRSPETGGTDKRQSALLNIEKEERDLLARLKASGAPVSPVDPQAMLRTGARPNVCLVIMESFRHSAVSASLMNRLNSWSRQGLRSYRHYSSSNCTHLGIFSILYGRDGLCFNETVGRGIPPQMCESLRRSGYKSTFLAYPDYQGFQKMDQFVNTSTFDRVMVDRVGATEDHSYWPESDRRILRRVRDILHDDKDGPQFVVAFLLSTHYPYVYPPDGEVFNVSKPTTYLGRWLFPPSPEEIYLNRYKNAALFLEGELMELIGSLDMKRNVVIITGDHGESMGEDGVWIHGGRPSEIQTRVPFLMVGAGVKSLRLNVPTGHVDILPTLLHALAEDHVSIVGCAGRDLLLPGPLSPEGVLVTPLGPDRPRDVVMVRENLRLLYKLTVGPDRLESLLFSSFLDESGRRSTK